MKSVGYYRVSAMPPSKSVLIKHHGHKWRGRKMVYLDCMSQLESITKGCQDRSLSRDLEAVIAAETTEWCIRLDCFQCLAQAALFYHPGPPTHGWHHLQWPRLSHINYQLRKCPTNLPTGIQYRHFLNWILSSWITPVCISVTKMDQDSFCLDITHCVILLWLFSVVNLNETCNCLGERTLAIPVRAYAD